MKKSVEEILKIFQGRKGFDNWWGNIDEEFQIEIKTEIEALLHSRFGKKT